MKLNYIDRKASSYTDGMNEFDRRTSIHIVQGSLGQANSCNNKGSKQDRAP